MDKSENGPPQHLSRRQSSKKLMNPFASSITLTTGPAQQHWWI